MKWNEELGREMPSKWTTKPLDRIADFLNGIPLQKYPTSNENEYLPVIKIRELKQGITNSTDKATIKIPEKYIVDDGDVLFSWSGSLECVIWHGGKGALNQHLFKVTSQNYPKWFYYFWIVRFLTNYQNIAKGKATTMGHIQRHHLSESVVSIPNIDVLRTVDQIMSKFVGRIVVLGVESRKLIQTRDLLLPKLISGKIRILSDPAK